MLDEIGAFQKRVIPYVLALQGLILVVERPVATVVPAQGFADGFDDLRHHLAGRIGLGEQPRHGVFHFLADIGVLTFDELTDLPADFLQPPHQIFVRVAAVAREKFHDTQRIAGARDGERDGGVKTNFLGEGCASESRILRDVYRPNRPIAQPGTADHATHSRRRGALYMQYLGFGLLHEIRHVNRRYVPRLYAAQCLLLALQPPISAVIPAEGFTDRLDDFWNDVVRRVRIEHHPGDRVFHRLSGFGVLAFGDVRRDRHDTDQAAGGVGQGRGGNADVDARAVASLADHFDIRECVTAKY